MKNARLTLCLVVLVSITSCLAEAKDRDPVQLTIYASPQIAKELAKRTLEGLDYSVSRDDATQTVFVKDMTGRAAVLTYQLLSSPASCPSIRPRLFLTLAFTATGPATVVTIFARVEHTQLFNRQSEWGDYMVPGCNAVLDVPHFMHTRNLLQDVLEKIRAAAEPRPTQQPPQSGPERWPTLLAGIH